MQVDEVLSLLEGVPNVASPNGHTEHEMDMDTAKTALKELCEHWTSKPESSLSIPEVAADRFGQLEKYQSDDLVPYGPSGLKSIYEKKQLCLVRLRYHFVRLGIMDLEDNHGSDDIAGAAFRAMFIRIHECLQRLYDVLMMSLLTRKCLDPQWASDCPSDIDPYNIRPFDVNKLSANQAFLVFILEQLQKRGLRRYRGACYYEIESPPVMSNGRPRTFKTHAWKKYMDIKEFINRCAPKETNFAMWQTSVDGPAKNRAIEQLENGYDIQFPNLEPDRHYHAFTNGIYDTLRAQFYTWGHKSITADITACKYHEVEFNIEIMKLDDWRQIDTPNFDTILKAQLNHIVHVETSCSGVIRRWTAESAEEELTTNGRVVEPNTVMTTPEGHAVIDWAYVFLGRLLYAVNYLDTWQVMPMFVGRAGTGKSLILSTVAKFFDDADVAVVSNDQQKGFGLETVYDKMLWMIKEVKADLSIDQAQLQSMITGEEMSIMRKGHPAIQVVWGSPGIIAGNELANWTDNSGSMSRRMILFYFHKKVANSDPQLAERLNHELPQLIHKCNRAYAEAYARFGHCDLWSKNPEISEYFRTHPEEEASFRGSRTILPSYFHNNKSGLKQQTHLMENFLANPDELVVRGKDSGIGMPFEADFEGRPSFKTVANAYFKKQEAKSFPWTKTDRYTATFDDYNLEVRRLTARDIQLGRNLYAGHAYAIETNWIFGLVTKQESNMEM